MPKRTRKLSQRKQRKPNVNVPGVSCDENYSELLQVNDHCSKQKNEIEIAVTREKNREYVATHRADLSPPKTKKVGEKNAEIQRRSRSMVKARSTEIQPDVPEHCDRSNAPAKPSLWLGGCTQEIFAGEHFIQEDFRGNLFDPSTGKPLKECCHCLAAKFPGETPAICCDNGKLDFPPFEEVPKFFEDLYTGQSPYSEVFLKYLTEINNAFSLASMKGTRVTPPGGGYAPSVVVRGRLSLLVGPIKKTDDRQPSFGQLYVMDQEFADQEDELRYQGLISSNKKFTKGDKKKLKELLPLLKAELKKCNTYIKDWLTAAEIIERDDSPSLRLIIDGSKRPKGQHERRYNDPSKRLEEISVAMHDDEYDTNCFVLAKRGPGNHIKEIPDYHRFADPFRFVMLFPTGSDGWQSNSWKKTNGTPPFKECTMREFYRYQLQIRMLRKQKPSPVFKIPMRSKFGGKTIRPFRNIQILHRARRLFQEYVCMINSKFTGRDLQWQRNNQHVMRAEKYVKLSTKKGQGKHIGKKLILSASFTGSPRYYMAHYLNGMALVRKYGKPDYFLTFTCNPCWTEIRNALNPGEQPCDRPDIVCRVFKLKLDEFIRFFKDNKPVKKGLKEGFGKVVAYFYSVEFQKRGLPHAHLLLFMAKEDKPSRSGHVDQIVSAEIPPNPENFCEGPEQDLARDNLDLVLNNMVHTCGHACLIESSGLCRRGFPKELQEHTEFNEAEYYPKYRRRGLWQLERKRKNSIAEAKLITDEWIVPYNIALLRKFRCHINVEIACSVRSVKYLFKYIDKGGDRIMIGTDFDEVSSFQDLRSYGSIESIWRLFEFPITVSHPPVQPLRIHLENEQQCYFNDEDNLDEVVDRGAPKTELTAFFHFNSENPGTKTLYMDFPNRLRYDNKTRSWMERKRGFNVGRVHSVHPTAGEVFYFRLLLHHEHSMGKTSFKDMRTIDGQEFGTFKEVCEALHMLENDGERDTCLAEAALTRAAPAIRDLFVTIILECRPASPKDLFENHVDEWIDDFEKKFPTAPNELLEAMALLDIESRVQLHEKELADYGLPQVSKATRDRILDLKKEAEPDKVPMIVQEQLGYDFKKTEHDHNLRKASLNEDQLRIYNAVTDIIRADVDSDRLLLHNSPRLDPASVPDENPPSAVTKKQNKKDLDPDRLLLHNSPRLDPTSLPDENPPSAVTKKTNKTGYAEPINRALFIDARGGTGKTYLLNTLLAFARTFSGKKAIALAAAFSGIAGTLLTLGKTAHSLFKIPICSTGIQKDICFNVPVDSVRAEMIRSAVLIVWDEAPMAHRYLLEALDRLLRELMNNDTPFGGKILVLAGDFRQVLPVIRKGKRAQTTAAAINQSPLWQYFDVKILSKNLRIGNLKERKEFENYLVKLGEGLIPVEVEPDWIMIPKKYLFAIDDASFRRELNSLHEFIDLIFPDLESRIDIHADEYITWIAERAILAPTNEEVNAINHRVIDRYPTEGIDVYSIDSTMKEDDAIGFSVEFLNEQNPPGIPPHHLKLKPGLILVMLRNLNPKKGLCNGTRLILTEASNFLLKCSIANGPFVGEIVLIPRIKLIVNEGDLPMKWRRLQFPVKPAFAMTINKAQGQTLKKVGVWLKDPCFSHGQLYVASSRVGNPDHLHYAIPASDKGITRNVVYPEALTLGSKPRFIPKVKSVRRLHFDSNPVTRPIMALEDQGEIMNEEPIEDQSDDLAEIIHARNTCREDISTLSILWNVEEAKLLDGLYFFKQVDPPQDSFYSCGPDSFLDLFYYSILPELVNKFIPEYCQNQDLLDKCSCTYCSRLSGFAWSLITYYQYRVTATSVQDLTHLNNLMWDKMVQLRPQDFSPKGTIDAEIQNLPSTLQQEDIVLHSPFDPVFGVVRVKTCTTCNSQSIVEHLPTIELFVDHSASMETLIADSILDSGVLCPSCSTKLEIKESKLGQFIFVNPSFVENPEFRRDWRNLKEKIELFGRSYRLCAVIKNTGHHFIAIVNYKRKFLILDDLKPWPISRASLDLSLRLLDSDRNLYCRNTCLFLYVKE